MNKQTTDQGPTLDSPGGALKKPAGHLLLATVAEIWSLFVDDGLLAFALVAWCAFAVWGLPVLNVSKTMRAPTLLAGCVVTLVGDVMATVLRSRKGK